MDTSKPSSTPISTSSSMYYLSTQAIKQSIMKRSHSSSPLSSGVRKSVRLADDSLTNPPSTSWPLPELIITSENLNIEEAQSACDAYNRVRSYARRNPADAASWRHAAALAKTVREIEDIMRTAHERVEEKLLKLESLTTDFRTAALNVPESYEDVDLLCMRLRRSYI